MSMTPTDMDLFRARDCAHWLADAVASALAVQDARDRRGFKNYLAVAQNRLEDIADALGLQVVTPAQAEARIDEPIIRSDGIAGTFHRHVDRIGTKRRPEFEPVVSLHQAVEVWKGFAHCALMRGDENTDRAEADFRSAFPLHARLMFGAPAPALALAGE
jgi:hypothetical protein